MTSDREEREERKQGRGRATRSESGNSVRIGLVEITTTFGRAT